ncbi:hypothetical protein H1D31_01465 [Alishewanella sp. BS5-314]|uniref:hypothetical protein n=1 Tax=Alishewanella sp. BS5-314 TaxID=2755587 RepID=UPI0021BB06C8|nr:hypothetical protein [Alishewanella sp. BS5-314]MCT8124705.1 hypothetical protein [Alishewanella sp. BS5-314]
MDWLTFISKAIDSLAWPSVILILGVVFRRQLSDLLPYLKKLKAGPVEAEFEMEARQALVNSEKLSFQFMKGSALKIEKPTEEKEALAKLIGARNDPAGMIIEAWTGVDGALFRLGKQTGLIVDPLENTRSVYRSIVSSDLLSDEAKRLVMELYELRNRVAHAKVKPTVVAAQDYVLAADKVIHMLEVKTQKLASIEASSK